MARPAAALAWAATTLTGEAVGATSAEAAPPAEAPRQHVGEAAVEHSAALVHVERAMSRLAELDRRLLGSYYGGASGSARAARDCGIEPALVKVRLFRARQRLVSQGIVKKRPQDD